MRFISTTLGRLCLLMVLFSGTGKMAEAATDPVVTRPLLGNLGQFKVDSVSYARDMKYFSLSAANRSAVQNNSILNMVGVGIDEQSSYYIRSNFSVTVTLQITAYNQSEAVTGIYNKTFTVNYDTAAGAKYKRLDYTTYANAFAMRVKIISIDSGNVNWPVSNVLRVENQLTATRDYPFNCNLAIEGLNTTFVPANNELTASWTQPVLDNNAGVTEYDLEWAWVDEGALAGYKNGSNYVQDLLFTNNATRVSISGSSFNIPLLYDDTGRVFVRVRPVQLRTDGQRVEGKWSWINNDASQPSVAANPVQYVFYGHEDKLNWQASTSFAEEGKHKTVVQYFDGSLRNRQTVTRDNTSNTTVVAESFYDYQGRPVIQLLPAPTLSTAIRYAANFNQAIGYNEYPKSVYDKLEIGATVCSNPARPFDTDFGTANYYSAKNPEAGIGVNKYIPDATAGNPSEGYPFSETRISPDGRVSAQSGAGKTHQLGSGHETRYFYETPAQEELDALFGTDAGVASHYFKSMVRDANGQFSVSYTDMHGRTVATALAGEAPKNADGSLMLDTLESKNEQLFTKQLLDKETNTVVGNSIISSKPIVVLKDNSTYAFDYTLTPKQLSLVSCSTNQPVCYDCLYTLKFTIRSDCDNQLVYADSLANFTLGQLDSMSNTAAGQHFLTQCNGGTAHQGFLKHFEKTLNQGSYTVTKTLSLSSEAQAAYRNKFLQTDTCKKLVDFYTQELALLQAAGNCAITCVSCKAALGNDLNGFIAKFAAEMNVPVASLSGETITQLTAAYNEAMAGCERICRDTDGMDVVRSTREIMLQDVTPPYGQYARSDAASQLKAYNIFNSSDGSNVQSGYGITGLQPDYMQPRRFAADDITLLNSGNYFNEFNQQETIQPASLLQPQQFINSFKTSWANQLLVHHPEFKKLQLTENQLKPAYQFEALLEKDSTWAQAAGHNYITNLVNLDPFFSGVGLPYKQRMISGRYNGNFITDPSPAGSALDTDPVVYGISQYKLPHTTAPCANAPEFASTYITMWQVALGSIFCREKADPVNSCVIDYSDGNTKAGCTMNPAYAQPQNTFSEGCATDRDWAWKTFKTLYLAERRKLIAVYLNSNAPSFSASYPNNGMTPYRERFINYANPQSVFAGAGINGAGNVGDIINTAAGNMTGGTQQAQALAQAQYDTVCRGYASLWISQLRSCPQINTILNNPATWVTDSTWLVTRLAAVCRNGADNNHYLGSSSVKPGNIAMVNGVGYSDFVQVVREFLQANSISNPTAECYEWMINTPKPYDKQKAITNTYVITKPGDCECQRISDLRMEWTNSGFAGTFSAYMQYQHGTYISNEQLDILTALCNGNYQCRMLEKPITLPPALQCPSSHPDPAPKTCISCADYTAIKAAFLTLTSQQAPFANPQNALEVNYNHAFASYANHQTGFSKTWQEYVAFQNTCNASNPVISCGSLDSTLNAFYASPEYLADPIGLTCIQAFVNYFNTHYNVVYTYSQWMALFAQCGTTPNVCRPKITCSSFTELVNGFYNQNGVQVFKNSNCQSLFVNYMNTQLGSNYNYSQLEAIYKYTCKNDCGLNVCGFPNAFLLTRVVADFKVAYPQPWNLADCQGTFAAYFNNYFGLPWPAAAPLYDFSGIYENYYAAYVKLGCVPDISMLCDPPYTCNDLQNVVEEFLATNPSPGLLADCQGTFAGFFNQQMGTSYSYVQIALLYQRICGTALTVCQVATDCKSIVVFAEQNPVQAGSTEQCHQQFLQLFNAYYGTSYASWAELYELYDGCGFDLNTVCQGGIVVVTSEMLNVFVKEFKDSYPDPATQLGGQCEDYFAARFNEQFGTKYTYGEIATYYLQQCQTVLDVCTSNCTRVASFISQFNTQYNTLKLPAAAREDLFVFGYNNAFLKGADANAGKTLEVSGSDKLAASDAEADKGTNTFNPLVNYPEIQQAITDCGITAPNFIPAAGITIYDPQVLLSLKQVYYITHPGGLPENCQADFASWFNTVMKTQYEYSSLLSLYNTVCGNNAGYICEPPADESNQASVYVDFMGTTAGSAGLPPMLCGLNEPGGGPVVVDDSPCKDLPKIAMHFALEKYELYVDSLRNVFDAAYREKCLAAKELESFTVTYRTSEYHYTLYYYDQAGQLVKTVPPAGVQKLSGADLQTVKNYRANVINGQPEAANQKVPLHILVTQYRYNTLGQVVQQQSPDAGLSKFYYDRLGRLAVSQNQKQATSNQYSYTLYDELGRIKEVGQKPHTTPITQTISRNAGPATTVGSLAWWINNSGGIKEQITRTVYDQAYTPLQVSTAANGGFYQKNLRNRVSYTYIKNTESSDVNYYWNAATFYSYDVHGNVDTLLQDYGSSQSPLSANAMNSSGTGPGGNRWKRIVYRYDLISGKVNEVAYQPGARDAFYHRYSYDAENRLTLTETSKDKIVWEKDARYNYYKHGALARTVLGELQVQGLDYAYTLPGQLKGINSTSAGDGTYDMANDGKTGGANSLVARDVMGISLSYYSGDYKPIGTGLLPFATVNTGNDLFNGNIKNTTINIPKLGDAITYVYRYDQLHRLKNADAYTGLNNLSNSYTAISINAYKERLTYDANGNIKTYLKNGENGAVKSNYGYTYTPGTNRLASITNSVNVQTKTYGYDHTGNITEDGMQGATNIVWNVYGKVQSLTNAQGQQVVYSYDVSGQRISKKVGNTQEWYVKDASGNEMATYKWTDSLRQTEVQLYGSGKLGTLEANINMQQTVTLSTVSLYRKQKKYYLGNYKEDVAVVISDGVQQKTTNNTTVAWYEAIVLSANYYTSYGAVSKELGTRPVFGFNGQRRSGEIGTDAQTAEFWEYNGDVGTRWNIDPRPQTSASPYAVFDDNPIWNSDALGDTSITRPDGYVGEDIPDYAVINSVSKPGKVAGTNVNAQHTEGAVESFTIGRKTFTANYNTSDGSFTGYKCGNVYYNSKLYIDLINAYGYPESGYLLGLGLEPEKLLEVYLSYSRAIADINRNPVRDFFKGIANDFYVTGKAMMSGPLGYDKASITDIDGNTVGYNQRISAGVNTFSSFAPLGFVEGKAAKTTTTLVQANRTAGNLFRDELAAALKAEGRTVRTEAYKWTPFGKRYIDIDVRFNGVSLGGIETKVGSSRYLPLQKLKDAWLGANGYPVQLVRKPANW